MTLIYHRLMSLSYESQICHKFLIYIYMSQKCYASTMDSGHNDIHHIKSVINQHFLVVNGNNIGI